MNHSAFYNPVWHTPVLPPIPQAVLDCHKPSLSLADRKNGVLVWADGGQSRRITDLQ